MAMVGKRKSRTKNRDEARLESVKNFRSASSVDGSGTFALFTVAFLTPADRTVMDMPGRRAQSFLNASTPSSFAEHHAFRLRSSRNWSARFRGFALGPSGAGFGPTAPKTVPLARSIGRGKATIGVAP
jgi:hypothetical protein